MAWAPKAKVIDLSPVADNLLGYLETNQSAALDWADGGDGIPEFQKFYTNSSGRLQTIFPSLMILTQTVATELGDILDGGLSLTLEGTIAGPETDALVANTKIYAKAVESMLANIPATTLTAASDPVMRSSLMEIETRHDVVRSIVGVSGFVQVFQVQCLYRLTASGY